MKKYLLTILPITIPLISLTSCGSDVYLDLKAYDSELIQENNRNILKIKFEKPQESFTYEDFYIHITNNSNNLTVTKHQAINQIDDYLLFDLDELNMGNFTLGNLTWQHNNTIKHFKTTHDRIIINQKNNQ